MLGNPAEIRTSPPSFAIIKWIVYVTIPAVVWFGVNYQTLRNYLSSQNGLDQNKIEVAKLEKEYKKLQLEKRQLETGGFSTEKTIRERFKMVRPGERVIFIEPTPGDSSAETKSTAPAVINRIPEKEQQFEVTGDPSDTPETATPKKSRAIVRTKRKH